MFERKKRKQEEVPSDKAELPEHNVNAEMQYQKRVMNERIEYLKMRDGVLEKPFKSPFADILPEEPTFKNKLKKFWYYNKWFVVIGFVVFALLLIIILEIALKPKGDMNVLSLLEVDYFKQSPKITHMIEKYIPDTNNDGKNVASIIEVPLQTDGNYNTFDQTLQSLSSQMNNYKSMLVVSDSLYNSKNDIENHFEDLTKEYPDNQYVDRKGFRLLSEKAKRAIGWDGMPGDIYISLKKMSDVDYDPTISASEKEKMKYQYDIAKQTLDKIIKDLS